MDHKIEAVARALCKLDGKDPDGSVLPSGGLAGGSIGFQRFAGGADGRPVALWTTYAQEAERFVVADEALALAQPKP